MSIWKKSLDKGGRRLHEGRTARLISAVGDGILPRCKLIRSSLVINVTPAWDYKPRPAWVMAAIEPSQLPMRSTSLIFHKFVY